MRMAVQAILAASTNFFKSRILPVNDHGHSRFCVCTQVWYCFELFAFHSAEKCLHCFECSSLDSHLLFPIVDAKESSNRCRSHMLHGFKFLGDICQRFLDQTIFQITSHQLTNGFNATWVVPQHVFNVVCVLWLFPPCKDNSLAMSST